MKMNQVSKISKKGYVIYGMVILAYLVMQLLVQTGSLSSLMTGLLVPLCIYVILAVSLNLTVGILGELSLGHAGFMCVGAFTGAFFSVATVDIITIPILRFVIAMILGALAAAVFGIILGIPVLRLKGAILQL